MFIMYMQQKLLNNSGTVHCQQEVTSSHHNRVVGPPYSRLIHIVVSGNCSPKLFITPWRHNFEPPIALRVDENHGVMRFWLLCNVMCTFSCTIAIDLSFFRKRRNGTTRTKVKRKPRSTIFCATFTFQYIFFVFAMFQEQRDLP